MPIKPSYFSATLCNLLLPADDALCQTCNDCTQNLLLGASTQDVARTAFKLVTTGPKILGNIPSCLGKMILSVCL